MRRLGQLNKLFHEVVGQVGGRLPNGRKHVDQNVVVGCVAENNPKYLAQALRLLQSMRWFGGTWSNVDFHICLVEQDNLEYRQKYNSYGAYVHIVPRFSVVHPPSNKLRFLELLQVAQADRVVLLDCDTVVVQDPSRYLTRADFLAKIADAPTVPHAVFANIFTSYGISLPKQRFKCTVYGESTIPYFNAGVLSFSHKAMRTLVPAWIRMNSSLIDQIHLLENCSNFCEQVSLSLALQQCDIKYRELGNEFNFPAHFQDVESNFVFRNTDPSIIHYHWLVDDEGYLLSSPYPKVDNRIQQFNSRLRDANTLLLDNQEFWNNRYSSDPTLGSGMGSRGIAKVYKQSLIGKIAAQLQPASILDVGCGDMAVGEILPEAGYTAIDVSDVVINVNIDRFPNRKFIHGDFAKLEIQPVELMVCLDVLIHLSDPRYYKEFVQKLVTLTQKTGIVAGYEVPPQSASDITFYHEPLSTTLKRAGAQNIQAVGGYRQVTLFKFGPAVKQLEVNNTYMHCGLHKPVFLVGAMRSGTTLLAELLDLSPHVRHCSFELKDIWSYESGVPMASPKTGDQICPQQHANDASPQQMERLIRAFAARSQQCLGKFDNSVFLNKNPHLCNKLSWVQALFPDARFIWIHRHLPQVVASLIRLFKDVRRRQEVVHVWPSKASSNERRCWEVYQYNKIPENIPADRIFPGGNLIWLAEYWLESNLAVKEFLLASPQAVLEIDEELLLEETHKTLARCLAHLELPLLAEEICLPAMEKERNQSWRTLLSSSDFAVLRAFVEQHGKTIDQLFQSGSQADMYMDWLEA